MDRDTYVEKMKAKIDEWNAEISKQEAKARVAQADMKLKYEDQVTEMKAQRDAFEAKLREARESNEKAWDDMRDGFEKAWHDMARAFDSAMKR
ncbi:MAG: hypothetical protein EA338_04615 [Roseinatronobacter sp.]|uniref:Uncharacterized protein n=1 Tax=Roseinatronobacter monicus TaxID=393481 RepID=A0A543KBQ6_9RHOB|nr:hypothetical protein [Roseinatronobacter monicus]TQM92523.1 hypothetical protein BD293_1131 [Roseinatronobacter monicus]TVQ00921.1 MAG: hypothetical protein EA338_04615 [Roseinatronobacter sp.]